MESIYAYIKVLRQGWWVIILCALGALSSALTLAYLETPVYRTSARFLISPTSNIEELRDVLSALNPLDDQTFPATFAEILQSNHMYEKSIQALGLDPEQMEDYEYRAVVLPESNVLELFVTGPDPEIVTYLANTIGYQTVSFIDEVYPTFDLRVLDTAETPLFAISPSPKRDGMIAGVLGAVAGAGILFAISQLQTILATIQDIPDNIKGTNEESSYDSSLSTQ